MAISAAGAFFYVIANGRHCWGRREGVGGSIAPCCMPLWNVRQLKRKQFESLSQITQQHLATCRKSCGKLQLQLSAPFVLFLCAIIIFKSFSEYSCNTHSGNLNCTCRRPKLPRAVCLENHKLSREILAVHATNGATKSEKNCEEEKRRERRKNGIQARRTRRSAPPLVAHATPPDDRNVLAVQRAAVRRGRSAARQINARCMQTSCKSSGGREARGRGGETKRKRGRDKERERQKERRRGTKRAIERERVRHKERERERTLTSALVRLFAVSASVCRRQQRHRAMLLLLLFLPLLLLL